MILNKIELLLDIICPGGRVCLSGHKELAAILAAAPEHNTLFYVEYHQPGDVITLHYPIEFWHNVQKYEQWLSSRQQQTTKINNEKLTKLREQIALAKCKGDETLANALQSALDLLTLK